MFEKILAKITIKWLAYEKFIRRIKRENKVNYGRLYQQWQARKNGGK